MSWESDLTDDIINALQENGALLAKINGKPTSIAKGINEDVFSETYRAQFPIIRFTWAGTDEENEPLDNLGPRFRTLTLNIHCGVYCPEDDERFDVLSDLTEQVANALYDREAKIGALLLDEINVSSIEVAPDVLMAPFGVAIMTVELTTWTERADRQGR